MTAEIGEGIVIAIMSELSKVKSNTPGRQVRLTPSGACISLALVLI